MEVDDVVEIRLWDENSAFAKLGKHLGLFRDRLTLTIEGDFAEKITTARRYVAGRDGDWRRESASRRRELREGQIAVVLKERGLAMG